MLLGRTRRELLATTTRGELMDLMAYDVLWGLPDNPHKAPPSLKYRRQGMTLEQVKAASK